MCWQLKHHCWRKTQEIPSSMYTSSRNAPFILAASSTISTYCREHSNIKLHQIPSRSMHAGMKLTNTRFPSFVNAPKIYLIIRASFLHRQPAATEPEFLRPAAAGIRVQVTTKSPPTQPPQCGEFFLLLVGRSRSEETAVYWLTSWQERRDRLQLVNLLPHLDCHESRRVEYWTARSLSQKRMHRTTFGWSRTPSCLHASRLRRLEQVTKKFTPQDYKGPKREHSSTLSLTSALDGMGG